MSVPLESDHALDFLHWSHFLRRTAVHPGSSPGQAFAGKCSSDHMRLTASCRNVHRHSPANRYDDCGARGIVMPFLREKSGRWSPEKISAFVGACVPALWLAWRTWSGDLSAARPVN